MENNDQILKDIEANANNSAIAYIQSIIDDIKSKTGHYPTVIGIQELKNVNVLLIYKKIGNKIIIPNGRYEAVSSLFHAIYSQSKTKNVTVKATSENDEFLFDKIDNSDIIVLEPDIENPNIMPILKANKKAWINYIDFWAFFESLFAIYYLERCPTFKDFLI